MHLLLACTFSATNPLLPPPANNVQQDPPTGLPPCDVALAGTHSEAAAVTLPHGDLQRSCSSRSSDGVLLSPFFGGASLPAYTALSPPSSTGAAASLKHAVSGRPPRPCQSRDGVSCVPMAACACAPSLPSPLTPYRGSLEDAGISAEQLAGNDRPAAAKDPRSSQDCSAARLGSGQLPAMTSAFAAATLSRASSQATSCDLSATAAAVLSELVELAHQQDAEEAAAGGKSGNSDGSAHTLLRCGSSMPTRLCEWLVDPADVEYLHHPGTNRLVELGSGARWAAFSA